MAVDRTDHIVYGWKLPYDLKNENGTIDLWSDKFLPMIEGHKGEEFTMIIDQMCGDYVVFGLNVKSGGDKHEGWDFVHLDFNKFDAEKVKAKYREVFDMKEGEPMGDPYLFIFSHFS